MPLSGPSWVTQYPTGRTTASLVQPFRGNVQRFITALETAGATVRITATKRPPERAWLMQTAWDVARGAVRPEQVPKRSGIDIQWVHTTQAASIEAARAMVAAYGLVYRPSLTSRHIQGRAIDMSIDWDRELEVVDGCGLPVRLRVGDLTTLYKLGASYGVMKLVSDPPHWSDDGR
jgi:hypothetical protein